MNLPSLRALAGLAIGLVLARSFVAIAMLACNSNAASLQPLETRQDPLDLQVFTLDSQGDRQGPFIIATISC